MSDTEHLNIGDFNPSTYEHFLPEGAHDFNDYNSDYAEQHPEVRIHGRTGRGRGGREAEILKTRSFTRNTVNSWIFTTASMAKSSKCQI